MLAVAFSETITLGALIVASLAAIATLIGVVYGSKWKTAAAVEAANSHAWEDTSRRQAHELEELRHEVNALRSRLSELEGRPDLASVLEALATHDGRVANALERHDQHAEKRADRMIAAIRETRGAA